MQQTLWQDEPKQNDPVALHLGDKFEMGFCWADGDTSPGQLERLAKLKAGTRDIIEDTQGGLHDIYIHRAWVDGSRVLGLCEAVRSAFGKDSYAPKEQIEQEDEEDEAC